MRFKAIILALGVSLVVTSFAKAPENIAFVRAKLIRYYQTGEYAYDISQVEQKADKYLSKRAWQNQRAKHHKKLAIVLDIDETSLSNLKFDLAHKLEVTGSQIDQNMSKGHDPVIPQTLHLYRLAKAHHIAVFFITGRYQKYRQATASNLKLAGYKTWAGLYLKPNHYKFHSAVPYKRNIRKKIEQKGYDIILSMGDQYSDLNGGYADHLYKLPNPYYFVP